MSVESEQNEVQDESEIVTLAHQMGFKVYYCKGVVCIAKHCKKGRELKAINGGKQHYTTIEGGDWKVSKTQIPTVKEPFILYYVDGSEENVTEITNVLKNGCDDKEV